MEQEPQLPKTSREMVTALISRLHPDSDTADEEVLFGHILDDYEQYAQVLESREADMASARAEGEIEGRNARIQEVIAEPADPTDGLPDLGGSNTACSPHSFVSIFDIARG